MKLEEIPGVDRMHQSHSPNNGWLSHNTEQTKAPRSPPNERNMCHERLQSPMAAGMALITAIIFALVRQTQYNPDE